MDDTTLTKVDCVTLGEIEGGKLEGLAPTEQWFRSDTLQLNTNKSQNMNLTLSCKQALTTQVRNTGLYLKEG